MSNYKVGLKIESVQDFQSHLDKGDDSFYILNMSNRHQRFPKDWFYKTKYGTVRNMIVLGKIYEAIPIDINSDTIPLFEYQEKLEDNYND